MITVAENPSAFDAPTLDGRRLPGFTKISGGLAKEKVEDQQQLLTKGANTVVRGTENAVVTYLITMWEIVDLRAWDGYWEPALLEGRRRQPRPRVWTLVDLRASWLRRVIFESLAPQGVDKPGGPWTRELVLHEYNRVAVYGGAIKPPDALDKVIASNEQTIKALEGQLKGPVAATKVMK